MILSKFQKGHQEQVNIKESHKNVYASIILYTPFVECISVYARACAHSSSNERVHQGTISGKNVSNGNEVKQVQPNPGATPVADKCSLSGNIFTQIMVWMLPGEREGVGRGRRAGIRKGGGRQEEGRCRETSGEQATGKQAGRTSRKVGHSLQQPGLTRSLHVTAATITRQIK